LGRRLPLFLHRFERGAVIETKRRPVAFPYAEVQVLCDATQYMRYRALRSDEPEFNATVSEFGLPSGLHCTITAADNRDEHDDPLGRACDAVLEAACLAQHDEVHERLAANDEVRFGTAVVSSTELVLEPWPGISWGDVQGMDVADGKFSVEHRGATRLLGPARSGKRVAEIANFPLFWELTHTAWKSAAPP
jgi:hypothetical protein